MRNSVAAVGAVWHHRAIHPVVMRVRILRFLPLGARGAVAKLLPSSSPLAAAAAWTAGDRAGAESTLRALATAPWSRRTATAIATSAALHRPDLAPTDLPPARNPRETHAAALLLRERGEPTAASALSVGSRRLERFRDIVDGELALLRGDIAFPSASHTSGDAVTHVVTNALPDVVAGYTTRTQGIAAAQAATRRVVVATRLGFPAAGGAVRAPASVTIDGVRYERRVPRRGESSRAEVAAAAEARALVETAAGSRVLHAHSHHVNGTVAQAAARALGIPFVYEVRGLLEETWVARGGDPDAEFVRLSREAETRVMRAADHVVTLSEGMRDAVVARGVPADAVSVVPNAVAADWLATADDARAARERLGISPDALLVGTVSSINGYEGLDLIGAVVSRLRALGVPATGVVVGDGPALPELRAAEGANAVRFVGKVGTASAREWHRAIDVFLVPRLDTSVTRVVTPIKPLEAMATGSLVIASDLPALREVVPESSGGLVIGRDADAWAQAIAAVVAEGSLAERGARARRWIDENRTWAALMATYDSVYASAGRRIH